jgi:hypothetical protein
VADVDSIGSKCFDELILTQFCARPDSLEAEARWQFLPA